MLSEKILLDERVIDLVNGCLECIGMGMRVALEDGEGKGLIEGERIGWGVLSYGEKSLLKSLAMIATVKLREQQSGSGKKP